MAFPKDFLWGAATSAPQIEGGSTENGRTPSIWDKAPAKKIARRENCLDACDHFHRWKEDIALMKEIGLKSYRFSVSWSRVMPEEGKISRDGLSFYRSLVESLRGNGIEPILTLFHWDLPVWMQKKGGWLSGEIPGLFASYTRAVTEALSDLVTYWIPMNEPQCFIFHGHFTGRHAPFRRDFFCLSRLTENCLRAFHESVLTIRKYAKKEPKIGTAMAASAFLPKNETSREIEKARRDSFFSLTGTVGNRWFSDPLLLGKKVSLFGLFGLKQETLDFVRTKLDFIGLNIYTPYHRLLFPKRSPKGKINSLGWPIDGRCLYWTLRFFYGRYRLPILVTENGTCGDESDAEDEKRIAFLREYLSSAHRAAGEGLPLLGYQYWSLLDNFEWDRGYAPRFGLIRVDYPTQKRTLKQSALFYRDVIRTNGENLAETEKE